MAWATKCDRCGMYFNYKREINGFAFLRYDRTKDLYLVNGEEFDLCPDCVKFLRIWFDRLREDDEQQ